MKVRQALIAINEEFESTIRAFEAEKAGGMHVPFHGDFSGALRLPSLIVRMRWWVREFKTALDEENENNEL